MLKESLAKITLALDTNTNTLIHIEYAKPKNIIYKCCGCNELLIVCNQGTKRNHYFKHKKNSECDGISKKEKEQKRKEEEQKRKEEEEKILDMEHKRIECNRINEEKRQEEIQREKQEEIQREKQKIEEEIQKKKNRYRYNETKGTIYDILECKTYNKVPYGETGWERCGINKNILNLLGLNI